MIEDDVRDILQSLLADTGCRTAAIVADDGHVGVPAKRRPLGGDRSLHVELTSRSPKPDGKDPGEALAVDAQLEVAARHLRAVARRWNVAQLPLMRLPPTGASTDRVIDRIAAFLRALAGATRGENAMLVHRGTLVAAATPLDEVWASRVSFLSRRALASASPRSSHGEVLDPDAFALTFYYHAVLIVAVDAPYAVDFVRHRCRLVARELSLLLPMLQPDPDTPAATQPT
ncbi:MAG: hypothetical protein R3B48_07385 [Kofleriaceae bacterium]